LYVSVHDRSADRILRVKAVCVFTNEDRILAIEGHDPTKGQSFWVPIGGRVEFGETSQEAIAREVEKELSAEITELRLLGVLENIFTFDGNDAHEIVSVYDARFADPSMYRQDRIEGIEENLPFTAHWIDPYAPADGRPLYPHGLTDLLASPTSPGSA
jgi:ADP-ribose pyrophosphatase YjhB (NUDIX family)